MKLLAEGTWSISSESDPRWNASGSGCVGGFEMPTAAKYTIEERTKRFGEEPPKDLKWSYMKY